MEPQHCRNGEGGSFRAFHLIEDRTDHVRCETILDLFGKVWKKAWLRRVEAGCREVDREMACVVSLGNVLLDLGREWTELGIHAKFTVEQFLDAVSGQPQAKRCACRIWANSWCAVRW